MSTRLVVHAGVTVSIALRDAGNKRLVFEYAVLDPSNGSSSGTQSKSQDTGKTVIGDALDSQGWSESPLALPFPSEVRVVGEEAIPNWSVPPVDTGGVACAPEPREKLDFWLSTTLSFTENVPDFEVLSDGKMYFFNPQKNPELTPIHRQIYLPFSPGHTGRNAVSGLCLEKQHWSLRQRQSTLRPLYTFWRCTYQTFGSTLPPQWPKEFDVERS